MVSCFNDYLYDTVTVYDVDETTNVLEIRKNASSSLRQCNYIAYNLKDLANLPSIDIFVREPYQRYLSAVKTLIKANTFNLKTIETYLFLDKHTELQFNYIVNLLSYTDAKLNIRPISEISEITPYRKNVSTNLDLAELLDNRFKDNEKLHYFLQFDNVFYQNLMNKTISRNDIIDVLENNYNDLYNEQVLRFNNMLQRVIR